METKKREKSTWFQVITLYIIFFIIENITYKKPILLKMYLHGLKKTVLCINTYMYIYIYVYIFTYFYQVYLYRSEPMNGNDSNTYM